MLTCQVCGCRSFPSISTLLSHVRVVHANEASFSIQCNLQGCHRTFKKFNTYRNHIYDFHDAAAAYEDAVPVSMDSMEDGSDMNDFDADTSDTDTSESGDTAESEMMELTTITEDDIQRASALWILKTRESHRIPQGVMDTIISDIQSLFQVSLTGISQRIKKTLRETEIRDSLLQSVLGHLKDGQPFCNIFQGLQSHHRQLNYFKAKFDLIVSRQKCIMP